MVLRVLNGREDIGGKYDTFLLVVLKVKNPKKITKYHCIIFNNIIYKLISKCITNRMMLALPKVIDEVQSAFLTD